MAVISVLAVGYSMLGKKILRISPPSVQRFDLEDTGKLVAIIAASEMTREYLIKQSSYQMGPERLGSLHDPITSMYIKDGKCSDVKQRCISKCTSFHW